jgi:hypothetical protein
MEQAKLLIKHDPIVNEPGNVSAYIAQARCTCSVKV